MTPPARLCYAQSGGVTATINAAAAGVIETARRAGASVFAAKNGILGALEEDLIDAGRESAAAIAALRHTPGGAFGSCRVKLPDFAADPAPYRRLAAVFRAHGIGALLYNGGNDSADTSLKIAAAMRRLNQPLACVGVPKTIDNDLAVTDCCPGFGSAAKYVAVSAQETALDVASMARTSTKVFVLEVMGRHAGWLAAAAGLADFAAPLILFPEIRFNQKQFLRAVKAKVEKRGWCVVVASEGLLTADGQLYAQQGGSDAFSHPQLGGVAPAIAALIKGELGYKNHWAVADYLQRAARHIASKTDAEQSYALGARAARLALAGESGVMPVVKRVSDSPYRWKVVAADLRRVANRERKLPRRFIAADGFGITAAARRYLAPLIAGEDYPPYAAGLPKRAILKNRPLAKKLPPYRPARRDGG